MDTPQPTTSDLEAQTTVERGQGDSPKATAEPTTGPRAHHRARLALGRGTHPAPPNVLLPPRPPRRRAQQERARQTIDAVLQATIDIIEREGENAVRIADITAATGVSHGAIYHHFVDRERLVQAAQFARLSRQPEQDLETMRDAMSDARTASELHARLDVWARSLCSAERAEMRRVRAAVVGSATHRPELENAVRALETHSTDDRSALIAEAERRDLRTGHIEARTAALLLEALTFGLVLREFVTDAPSEEDLVAAMRVVLRTLI